MEDSGLQIIRLWGPTIGNVENINFEILDLPSPKGSKTRVHGGGSCIIYIYIYVYIYMYMCVCVCVCVWGAFCADGHLHLPLETHLPRPCRPHNSWPVANPQDISFEEGHGQYGVCEDPDSALQCAMRVQQGCMCICLCLLAIQTNLPPIPVSSHIHVNILSILILSVYLASGESTFR